MDTFPSPDDLPPLGFTEKSDFSLFLQYPDLEFDPESDKMDDGPGPTIHASSPLKDIVDDEAGNDSGPGPAVAFSSPASDHRHRDDTDSTSISASTPHTTPRRLDALQEDQTALPDECQEYFQAVAAAPLTGSSKDFFRNIAQHIMHIAFFLQPKKLYLSETTTRDILDSSNTLSAILSQAARLVASQISSIHHLTHLAPFAITPTDLALYPIYCQRCSLIIKYLSLPSQAEANLVSEILPLFDAYIYSPYLHLPRHHFTSTCAARINELYNSLQTLINSYKTWLRLMTSLKENYIAPIRRRIEDSTWVQTEIEQMEEALHACELLNRKLLSEVMKIEVRQEQVEGAERLAERRTKSSIAIKASRDRARRQVRVRTRVRREHTM